MAEDFFPEEQDERMRQAFLEGFAQGVARMPAPNVMETSEGPVEGRPTPEGMAFDTIRGEFLVRHFDDGGIEITRYGRIAARMHPLEAPEPDDDDDDPPGP